MRRILILFMLLPVYLPSLADTGDQIKQGSDFNWITIWLSFFFGLLFTILFRFLNGHSKKIDQRSDPGLPMNGWIIFLGVNLFVRMLIQIYFFYTAHYFFRSGWLALAQAGGVSFHSLIIFELFLSLFSLTGTGALIYWFLGRRDIFPSMFIYYAVFYLLATTVLLIVYHKMNLPADMIRVRRNTFIHLFRIVYAAAWVIFVYKSTQVKKTFVYSG